MSRYALLLRYDGGACRGVWRQADSLTVGGALDQAFTRLGEPAARAVPAARTDAGVHALGQVVHVDCQRTWSAAELLAALAHHLPPWLACRGVAQQADAWHATHDATGKTYRYFLDLGPGPDPFRSGFTWRPPHGVNVDVLNHAAAAIPTELDAKGFVRRGDHRQDFRTTLAPVRWHRHGTLLCGTIRGSRFTYRLVRSLIGGMVAVAHGGCQMADWRAALAGENTHAARQQAPAHGLWLARIHYRQSPAWISWPQRSA